VPTHHPHPLPWRRHFGRSSPTNAQHST
jgi:hypothetical protein